MCSNFEKNNLTLLSKVIGAQGLGPLGDRTKPRIVTTCLKNQRQRTLKKFEFFKKWGHSTDLKTIGRSLERKKGKKKFLTPAGFEPAALEFETNVLPITPRCLACWK